MNRISAYILTHNSEKYLSRILDALTSVADEVLVIDSGSIDNTEKISRNYPNVRFIFHKFENFRDQRIFAESECANSMVLFLDSDEIPDSSFIKSIHNIKNSARLFDVYRVTRNWKVLGKTVHCIYPVSSPDNPIRLYNKNVASFKDSQLIHETQTGYSTIGRINGRIEHYTFETRGELNKKLEDYTTIAAQDLIIKKKQINFVKILINPIAAFIKWYFSKDGYKDGIRGIIIAKYAYDYTRLKYVKAWHILKQDK